MKSNQRYSGDNIASGPKAIINRSGRSQVFFEICVLKNFARFTEKHMCWSLFLKNVANLRPANFQ